MTESPDGPPTAAPGPRHRSDEAPEAGAPDATTSAAASDPAVTDSATPVTEGTTPSPEPTVTEGTTPSPEPTGIGQPPVAGPLGDGPRPQRSTPPQSTPQPPVGSAPAGAYPPPGGNPPQGAYAPPPGGYPPPPASSYPSSGGYPPAGGYAPPASGYAGAPGPDTAGTIRFDTSKATINDWIVIGSGLVLLVFSFFGWLSVSFSGGLSGLSGGGSTGSWNEYWWLATVLGVAVAVVVALRVLFAQSLPQVKPVFLAVGAAAGFVITLIALIEIFARGGSVLGITVGPGVGIWVCLIVSLAQTYLVWTAVQDEPGWSLPKFPKIIK